MSNRYDSILQWLWTEKGLRVTDLLSYPNLEMLSHLKSDRIQFFKAFPFLRGALNAPPMVDRIKLFKMVFRY